MKEPNQRLCIHLYLLLSLSVKKTGGREHQPNPKGGDGVVLYEVTSGWCGALMGVWSTLDIRPRATVMLPANISPVHLELERKKEEWVL